MAAAKKGGLGRGLDALFADAVPVYDEAGAVKAQAKDTEKKGKAEYTAGEKSENDGVRYIKIHDIMPNLNQPRKTFQEDKIEELAASIKEHGIIQPIVVRKQENGLRDRSRRAQMARGQKGRIITGSLSGQRADR